MIVEQFFVGEKSSENSLDSQYFLYHHHSPFSQQPTMVSTTTKKMRTKRPDTRPNEKERRKIGKKIEDQKVVQQLRVTRKRKSDHVERVVERAPEVKQSIPENEKVSLLLYECLIEKFVQ